MAVTLELSATDVLAERYARVRARTESLAAPLSPEDQTVQSMPDASPTKWHRAHTTWFFETFLLGPLGSRVRAVPSELRVPVQLVLRGGRATASAPERGLVTRPGVAEVGALPPSRRRADADLSWRRTVRRGRAGGADRRARLPPRAAAPGADPDGHQARVVPQRRSSPAYVAAGAHDGRSIPVRSAGSRSVAGSSTIGHAGDGFAFDNEGPRHDVILRPFRLADRVVTVRRVAGVHGRRRLPARRAVAVRRVGRRLEERAGKRPLYWRPVDDGWRVHTLARHAPGRPRTSRCATSASTRPTPSRAWAGARLPTEFEWEHAAARPRRRSGAFLDSGEPASHRRGSADGDLRQLFGDVLGVDGIGLPAVPRVPAGRRRGRRVQRQVHGQPARAAGRLRAHPARPRPADVPQLLPSRHARWHCSGVRLAEDDG